MGIYGALTPEQMAKIYFVFLGADNATLAVDAMIARQRAGTQNKIYWEAVAVALQGEIKK